MTSRIIIPAPEGIVETTVVETVEQRDEATIYIVEYEGERECRFAVIVYADGGIITSSDWQGDCIDAEAARRYLAPEWAHRWMTMPDCGPCVIFGGLPRSLLH